MIRQKQFDVGTLSLSKCGRAMMPCLARNNLMCNFCCVKQLTAVTMLGDGREVRSGMRHRHSRGPGLGVLPQQVRHLFEGQQLLFVLAEQDLDRHILDTPSEGLVHLHVTASRMT